MPLVAGGLLAGLAGFVPAGPAAAAPGGAARPADVVAAQADVARLARHALEQLSATGSLGGVRRVLAIAVANTAGVEAGPVVATWEAASRDQLVAAVTGLAQIGVPYRRLGGAPDDGFDCSGFTSWAWAAAGVELPHSSGGQLSMAGHRRHEAQLADLVGYPGHVLMYLGGGAVVHSPTSGRTVEVDALRRHRDHFVSPVRAAEGDLRHAFVMAKVRAF